MRIESSLSTKTVMDFDFYLDAGLTLPVTIDADAGDCITVTSAGVDIHIAAKPSLSDPGVMIPAEDIFIYPTHLMFTRSRPREVTSLSPEQQVEWAKTLQKIGGTVQ